MAIHTVNHDVNGPDETTRSFADLLDLENARRVGGSATLVSFELPYGYTLRISGHGFTYDDLGQPATGTVTLIRLFHGYDFIPIHSLSGLNLALPALIDQADAYSAAPSLLQAWLMAGNDTLTVNDGREADLFGGLGDDTFNARDFGAYMRGGAGKDTFNAGLGYDSISFEDAYLDPTANRGAVVNLTTRTVIDAWGNRESYTGSVERLVGSQFTDQFTGSAAVEQFLGLVGRDLIDGGKGLDIVRYDRDEWWGGLRGVTVDLASGQATDGFGRRDTLVNIEGAYGTNQNDKLLGDSRSNVLHGLDGDDYLDGGTGADVLHGGTGNDTYVFDNSRDFVSDPDYYPLGEYPPTGIDTIHSTINLNLNNKDQFSGSIENIVLLGQAMNAVGNELRNTITGNAQNNRMNGESGSDTLSGAAGNDIINGGFGDDTLDGGLGNDTLYGSNHDDVLRGGEGADTLYGGNENDILHGDGDSDILNGDNGNDTIYGGDGVDILRGGNGSDKLYGGEGNDTIYSGNNGLNTLIGGAGRDALIGGSGRSDTASYEDAGAGLVASLLKHTKNTGDAYGDSYVSIENLVGSRHADTLEGDGGANLLDGGRGSDILTGGAGADTFRFSSSFSGYDRITDFSIGEDVIQLDLEIFTGLFGGSGRALAAHNFVANTTGAATNSLECIIYETDTGRLRFDADGDGAGASILFAGLTPGLDLSHEDFTLIYLT